MNLEKESLKKDFTNEEIIKIVLSLGSENYKARSNGELIFQTVCHNKSGGSYKLYYYPESLIFHCYTDCSNSFDIYELVQRNKKCEFKEALYYINSLLGIKKAKKIGFVSHHDLSDDWDVFKKYDNNNIQQKTFEFTTYPNMLINYYYHLYPVEWIQEDIKPETIDKYSIRYDLTNNKIVIPQYSLDNQLIGIRGRALNQDEVDLGQKYMPLILENTVFRHPTAYNLYGLNITQKAIKQTKKIMLFEAEKSVLKCDGFYGDDNFTVACCGSNISLYQRNLILSMGVKEVFIAFDKEYHEAFTKESDTYSEKILSLSAKFCPYVTTWVIWDTEGLLDYKDAPCDKGQETFEKLMKNKFEVTTWEE